MAHRDIVVIGASAGGVSTLLELTRELHGFRGSLLVVVHVSQSSPGVLPQLLGNVGTLTASFAQNGESPLPGHIYVARPGFHFLIRNQRFELTHGPRENGFRPAVDPLFRTAARNFGKRVVGVVLSGGLDDGTDGLRIIKEFGGIAIVQDPQEAILPSMPQSAIQNAPVDHVAKVKDIARLLRRYAGEEVAEGSAMNKESSDRPDVTENGDAALRHPGALGPPSMLTCPDCGGALWEFTAGRQLRYRCHVGHLYTGDGLTERMDESLEQTLWSAVRALEEAAALRMRMAALAEKGNWSQMSPPYRQHAEEFRQRAQTIRSLLRRGFPQPAEAAAADAIEPRDTLAGKTTGRTAGTSASRKRAKRR